MIKVRLGINKKLTGLSHVTNYRLTVIINLFTNMFYVGVAGLATSSVAGIVTTGSDMLANKFKTKKMKEVLEKSKEIEENLKTA